MGFWASCICIHRTFWFVASTFLPHRGLAPQSNHVISTAQHQFSMTRPRTSIQHSNSMEKSVWSISSIYGICIPKPFSPNRRTMHSRVPSTHPQISTDLRSLKSIVTRGGRQERSWGCIHCVPSRRVECAQRSCGYHRFTGTSSFKLVDDRDLPTFAEVTTVRQSA